MKCVAHRCCFVGSENLHAVRTCARTHTHTHARTHTHTHTCAHTHMLKLISLTCAQLALRSANERCRDGSWRLTVDGCYRRVQLKRMRVNRKHSLYAHTRTQTHNPEVAAQCSACRHRASRAPNVRASNTKATTQRCNSQLNRRRHSLKY